VIRLLLYTGRDSRIWEGGGKAAEKGPKKTVAANPGGRNKEGG